MGVRSEHAGRRPQDVQALHRREVPAQRERPLLRGVCRAVRCRCTPRIRFPRTEVPRERRPGFAQGRPRCRRRRAQGAAGLGGGHGVQPRPGALPGGRGHGGAAGAARAGRARQRGRDGRARRGDRVRGDRPVGLVRRVVRQVHPGARRAQPRGRPLLRHLGARGHRRRRGAGAAGLEPARPGVGRGAGDRVGQHRRGAHQRGPAAAGDHPGRVPRDVRRARAAWSTSSPAAPARWRRGSPATATSTPSTSPAPRVPTVSTGVRSRRPRPRTSSGCCDPAARGVEAVEPDFSATPDLSRLSAFLETKTVWHPKGR